MIIGVQCCKLPEERLAAFSWRSCPFNVGHCAINIADTHPLVMSKADMWAKCPLKDEPVVVHLKGKKGKAEFQPEGAKTR